MIILSAIAAIVIPEFRSNSRQAKETSAKANLKTLREVIERYAAEHDDTAPGYSNGNADGKPTQLVLSNQLFSASNASGGVTSAGTSGYGLGPYLTEIPENTLNNKSNVTVLGVSIAFPTEATGTTGWIYKPSTKEVKLNYPGNDLSGVSYYSY